MSTNRAATLTTKALQQAFGVSHVTIAAWRQATGCQTALPIVDLPGRDVRFSPAKVRAWAKREGREIVNEAALEPGSVKAAKPGPTGKPVVKKSALRVKQVSKGVRPSVKAKFARAAKRVNEQMAKANEKV